MNVTENEADDLDFVPKPLWYVNGGTQNEVWKAGAAFYEAAAVMFRREKEQDGRFWAIQKWHVIHHLSYIACELFIKAMLADEHFAEPDQDGYADITGVEVPKIGHNLWPDKLSQSPCTLLEDRLTPDELKLLRETTDGKDELCRGRYPYEFIGYGKKIAEGETVSAPDREDALRWLALARSLRNIP